MKLIIAGDRSPQHFARQREKNQDFNWFTENPFGNLRSVTGKLKLHPEIKRKNQKLIYIKRFFALTRDSEFHFNLPFRTQ